MKNAISPILMVLLLLGFSDQLRADVLVSSSLDSGQFQSTYVKAGPDDVLEIGSIAKYACTLAVLSAVDSGDIDLDAPISTYLKTLQFDEVSPTVAQILSNRSGLQNNLPAVLKARPHYPDEVESTQQASRDLLLSELAFTPGMQWDYEIMNWVVIQFLLESVLKQDITTILYERVFEPAKMSSTLRFVGNLQSPNPAINQTASRPIPSFMTCAGGIAGSPSDLIRLARFPFYFVSDPLQSRAMALTTPQQHYALGGRFKAHTVAGQQRIISHQSGQNGDFRSAVIYVPELDIGFAVMTTDNSYDIQAILGQWLAQVEK